MPVAVPLIVGATALFAGSKLGKKPGDTPATPAPRPDAAPRTAQPRDTPAPASTIGTPAPPNASLATSGAAAAAKLAGDKQRKRAGAGMTLLGAGMSSAPSPKATLERRTLIGRGSY